MKHFIIAIDGPSGAGKSTLGKMLARELGALYIDTGAMYRAAALAALEDGVDLNDHDAVARITRESRISLFGEPGALRVHLDGRDVTEAIRTESVTNASSIISTIPAVRRTLVDRQREMGKEGSVVLDGRDIGTVVFPDADVKFFLTAKPEERAHRRFEEELDRRHVVTYDETLADINSRDQRDSTRADSPLKIADGATVIDSSELSIEQVFERMMAEVKRHQAGATV
jgi:CMP/dCMP kinase